MSWFNTSHLSSFAKQALSTAQKSIDRVLDIKEDGLSWDGGIAPNLMLDGPGSVIGSGGEAWGSSSEWGTAPHSEEADDLSPAITTPVSRTLNEDTDSFFSAFLTGEQDTSSPRPGGNRVKEKDGTPRADEKKSEEPKAVQRGMQLGRKLGSKVHKSASSEPSLQPVSGPDTASQQQSDELDGKVEGTDSSSISMVLAAAAEESTQIVDECSYNTGATAEETSGVKAPLMDGGSEDRQSKTPSPPAGPLSSGTSSTSDIEVLDHESVKSENSASSRADHKAALAPLVQVQSFLPAPGDDDQRLYESGSSSTDGFERIDSVSVRSLDSRSISEVNSDDEVGGSRFAQAQPASYDHQQQERPQHEEQRSAAADCDRVPFEGCVPTDEDIVPAEGKSNTQALGETLDPTAPKLEGEEAGMVMSDVRLDCDTAGAAHDAAYEKMELQKIIDELTQKLEQREGQLLTVSKERAVLEEAQDNLQDELTRLRDESSTVVSLREEFTQRIADAERKAQAACKERDATKKELKLVKQDLATRLNSNETAELLRQKDEQVKGLLEEGEKLSKQQLQTSTIIKKLRAKEKENEGLLSKHSRHTRELEGDLQQLQQVLDGKEEVEKQHRDNIRKLNAVVERQEKETARLQAELLALQENNRTLQAAYDNAYKELTELHRANASRESEAQEAVLSREVQAHEQMRLALEQQQEEAIQQHEALSMQVTDLRLALQRAEQQQARKEDYFRQELSEMQQRLQEAEGRNQELSHGVSTATRPLLRQIENLQGTLSAQSASWEKLERSLSDRLAESQMQQATAVQRERAAQESMLASMQSQEVRGRLHGQLDMEKQRQHELQEQQSRSLVELETLREEHLKTLEEARKDKTLLLSQLEVERAKVDAEKKRALIAQEALKEKVRLKRISVVLSHSSSSSVGLNESVSGPSASAVTQVRLALAEDHTSVRVDVLMGPGNVYEALRLNAGSSVIESLQSQLKQREGEITQLQTEIGKLERTRMLMTEELVKLSTQNEELQESAEEVPKLKGQLKDLEQRYNTMLQMYGEKAEEAEELRLDLQDIKNMYKAQIEELLRQRPS
uniref:TATA element modulatory factor 1 n=1 Tax=Petromyzon marinus TaxID=7757 RepID=S4RVR4_PETMA